MESVIFTGGGVNDFVERREVGAGRRGAGRQSDGPRFGVGNLVASMIFTGGGVNGFTSGRNDWPAAAAAAAIAGASGRAGFAAAGCFAAGGRKGLTGRFISTARRFGSGVAGGVAISGAGDHTSCGVRPSSFGPATILWSNFLVARSGRP